MDHTLALIMKSQQGDKEARDTVFKENAGLVYSMAKRFAGRSVEMEDIVQIGSIGLLKAIDRFDISYDVKFSTYAVPMIIGEIRRYLRDDGMLKVSRNLKENCARIYSAREALEKELASIQTKLEDKQDKLRTADQQLEALKRDMDAIGERTEELKGEAYKYSREIHSNVDVLLKDVMLETLVGEHSARVAEMGAAEQSVFDGSLLQSLTEQGAEVMHCATLLFLGMVNDATTFAETHGGGGSKSNLKWGKDDDEDNRAWARRCMMMASRMMRPASGKKQKR